MGYESKLYVVDKSNLNFRKDLSMVYGQVIATYDACKFPALREIFDNASPTDCYIYSDDGDTIILKDCYGDPLKEASISDVLNGLERKNDENTTYRRAIPLLAMLRAFRDIEGQWERLVILHYGH